MKTLVDKCYKVHELRRGDNFLNKLIKLLTKFNVSSSKEFLLDVVRCSAAGIRQPGRRKRTRIAKLVGSPADKPLPFYFSNCVLFIIICLSCTDIKVGYELVYLVAQLAYLPV